MEEQELITRFQAGEVKADKVVFDQFYQALCYFAERMVSDAEVGQRIVIDAFEKLFQKRKNFETLANIKAFLYISCKNASLNYLRSRDRHRKWEKDFIALQEDRFIELETIEAKVVQQIRSAVDSLPDQCRQVIVMLYFEDQNYSQVATSLGLTESTVRNHKRNAFKLLREKLGPSGLFFLAMLFYCGILPYVLSQQAQLQKI